MSSAQDPVTKTTDTMNVHAEQAQFPIEVIACEITIPNVFTPNGDGKNDYLVIENLEYYPDNKIVIFNRWGNKIFEKEGYKNDWDGDGHSDGTYFYILELNDFAERIFKGTITVFK